MLQTCKAVNGQGAIHDFQRWNPNAELSEIPWDEVAKKATA